MALPARRTEGTSAPWIVEWRVADALDLHARPLPDPPVRLATVCSPTRPAIVLGSAQRLETVRAEVASGGHISVGRRRGGGGAVWLSPGEQLWIDVVVPRTDPLWSDDVGRAFDWLGETWRSALADLGVEAAVHQHGLVPGRWSRLICFGGLGSGEVHVGGAKLVGISQRRVREAARFQCVVYDRFDARQLVKSLDLEGVSAAVTIAELEATALGLVDVAPHAELSELEGAFLQRLP